MLADPRIQGVSLTGSEQAGISVAADDPAALAGAVEFLAGRTPQQLLEYGVRGRRYVEQNYSIPALVDRFEAMACELTGLPAGMDQSACV